MHCRPRSSRTQRSRPLLRLAPEAVRPPASGPGVLRRSARSGAAGHQSVPLQGSTSLRPKRHTGVCRQGRSHLLQLPLRSRSPWQRSAGHTFFGYWHIQPVVQASSVRAEAPAAQGVIESRLGPRSLYEKRNDKYVNPLRPGALSPACTDVHAPDRPAVTVNVRARRLRRPRRRALAPDDPAQSKARGPMSPSRPPCFSGGWCTRASARRRWITAADFRSEAACP